MSRVISSTITATLSGAWEDDLTVTLPAPPVTDPDYSLSVATIPITAGGTTGTSTLTAIDDTIDQTTPDSRSVSLSTTSIDSYVVGVTVTNATITIGDDDNVSEGHGGEAVGGRRRISRWTGRRRSERRDTGLSGTRHH